MTPNINLRPDVYRKVGQYGNRDEAWNTVILRLLEHVDEEAALEDKNNRQTTDESGDLPMEETGPLSRLDDGTPLRHRYQRGDYSGERVEAEVRGGMVSYGGESLSPSRAAIEADGDLRGGDASSTHNGWTWWEYQRQDGEWKQIDDLR